VYDLYSAKVLEESGRVTCIQTDAGCKLQQQNAYRGCQICTGWI